MMFRLGGKAQASGDFADFDAVLRLPVLLDESVDALLDFLWIDVGQRLPDSVKGYRFTCQVNDRFKQGGKIGIAHNLDLRGP